MELTDEEEELGLDPRQIKVPVRFLPFSVHCRDILVEDAQIIAASSYTSPNDAYHLPPHLLSKKDRKRKGEDQDKTRDKAGTAMSASIGKGSSILVDSDSTSFQEGQGQGLGLGTTQNQPTPQQMLSSLLRQAILEPKQPKGLKGPKSMGQNMVYDDNDDACVDGNGDGDVDVDTTGEGEA